MKTLARYFAVLLETHPYYERTAMVVIPERATPENYDPDAPLQHTIGREDDAWIVRDYIGWIINMMAETMPVAMSRVSDWYTATSQADQAMMLVDGAQRLETFVELANASAEAASMDRFLVLRYSAYNPEISLHEVLRPRQPPAAPGNAPGEDDGAAVRR